MSSISSFVFSVIFTLILFTSIAKSDSIFEPPEKLNDGWNVSTPRQEGMDPHQLTEMVKNIINEKYENIDSVVIIKNGKLVFEKYFGWHFQWRKHQIRSATKSIASTLTGIAIDKKYISNVDEKIYPYFSEYEPEEGWDNRMKQITLKHLLNMTTGLECDDWKEKYECEHEIDHEEDWVQFVLDKKSLHPPGEYYAYSTTSLVLLGEIIAKASHMTLVDFADKYLFEPLGIADFQWRKQGDVVYIGGSARMRSRDMAKIGYLFLNEGKWKGKQIVSKNWIEESTNRNFEEGPGWGRLAIRHQYLWWSFNDYIHFQKVKGYYSSGNGGQHFMIFPSLDLVVAVTGSNYNSPKAAHSLSLVTNHILPSLIPSPHSTAFKPLNSKQLREEIEGNTFYFYEKGSGNVSLYLSSDGIIHGTISLGFSDQGLWYINDPGVFCRIWKVWGNKKESCSRFYQKGDVFEVHNITEGSIGTMERKKGNPEGY